MSCRILPSILEPVYPDGWTPETADRRRSWSPRELQVMRERYLQGGTNACQALLPARQPRSIQQKAQQMHLRRTKTYRRQAPSTPEIDQALRQYYSGKLKRGQLKALAARFDRPKYWLLARARALGIVVGRLRPTAWDPAEIAILQDHCDLSDTALQHKLRRAGFERTVGAIAGRCWQLRLPRGGNPDQWSAHELGRLLGCDSKRVLGWINRGWLKSTRVGDGRTVAHQIHRKDLRKFLVGWPGEWDHRPVDRLFLIEVLAGTVGAHHHLKEAA